MTDVFMYQAALYCPDCIRDRLLSRDDVKALVAAGEVNPETIATGNLLRVVLAANGCDPDCESSWDSGDFPKGPYPNGGGEADSPQHCDDCHCFLCNPLTGDGYEYVLAALQAGQEQGACILTAENMHTADDCTMHDHEPAGGNPEVLREWRDYYGSDRMPDDLGRSINDILDGPEDDGDDDPEAEADSWLMAGDWFECREGFLYIVPLPDVVAECHGPDNATMDLINAACRDHDRLTDDDCERLGLSRIADILKRYTPEDGYYHA